MIEKKWTCIQPLRTSWTAPNISTPWSNNPFHNDSKLLRANAYHIDSIDIEMDSDVYLLISYDIGNLEKEIKLVKELKSKGAKIVIGFSFDLRFLIGDGLLSPSGTLYTALCKEVDIILSGVSDNYKCYGRYQDKVFPLGMFLERLNLSTVSYENRNIDLLISSSMGEECFGFTMETLLTIKEKYPDKRIVYSISELSIEKYKHFQNEIEFSNKKLLDLMPYAKVYYNPEMRPRSGRAIQEAWYCRTPFISHSWVYFSKIFPEFTYTGMDMQTIASNFGLILNSNYDEIIKRGEKNIEEDYFDKLYPRLMKRLFPDE